MRCGSIIFLLPQLFDLAFSAGTPASVVISSPAALDTQADAVVEVKLEVRNGLGVLLPPDAACCRSATVRFEALSAPADLTVKARRVGPAWTYSVELAEPRPDGSVSGDVLGEFEAVLAPPGGRELRSGPISLHYLPRARLQSQSDAQRLELQSLRNRKAELEARRRLMAAQAQRKAELRAALEKAQAALRSIGPQSAMERI